jgi:hypothetical protein
MVMYFSYISVTWYVGYQLRMDAGSPLVGFVPAAKAGVGAPEAAVDPAAPAVGAAAAAVEVPPQATAPNGPMRWNNNTSGFVLRRMA